MIYMYTNVTLLCLFQPLFEDLGIKVGCLCPTFAKTALVTGVLDKAGEDPEAQLFKASLEAMGYVE